MSLSDPPPAFLARAIPETILIVVSLPFLWLLRRPESESEPEQADDGISDDRPISSNDALNTSSQQPYSADASRESIDDVESARETDALLGATDKGKTRDGVGVGGGTDSDKLKWAKMLVYSLLVKLAVVDFLYVLWTADRENLLHQFLPALVDRSLPLLAYLAALVLSYRSHVNLARYKRASPLLLVLPLLIAGNAYALFELASSSDPEPTAVDAVTLALLITAFVLELLPKTTSDPKRNPVQEANVFSQLTYSWLSPVLRLGSQRPLTLDDLPPLRLRDTTNDVCRIFLAEWQRQVASRRPSLWAAYIHSFGLEFALGGLLKLFQDLLSFVQPILLSELISFAASYSTDNSPTTTNPPQPPSRGILICLGMLSASLFQSSMLQAYFFKVMSVALRAESGTISAIYEKALKTAKGEGGTSGEVVNLQSVDADRIGDTIPYLHVLWSGPLQIVIAIFLLYRQLGPSTLVGVGIIVLLIPLNAVIAKIDAKLEGELMEERDVRGKRTEELWRGISIVRMYGWESSFVKRIEQGRGKELKTLGKLGVLSAVTSLIWTCSPFFVSLASFGTFALFSGEPLTARRIFVSLSLFNMMTFPLVVFPMMVNDLIQAIISVRRIENYLAGEEVDPDAITHLPATDDPSQPAVVIHNGTFSWVKNAGPPTLNSLDIELASGSLTAVTGRVGAGKSSLLSALLGEIPKLGGTVTLRLPSSSTTSLAYVPQTPYIRNATVRANILFNRPFDQQRYDSVLEACSLRDDLHQFPSGDMTEIGSRGVNLSGGQRARIALARAAYGRDEVILLDDPLSAVDARVAKAIFENCIGPNGILAGRTRILVTHGVGFLKDCDKVIALKGGKLVEPTPEEVEETTTSAEDDNASEGTLETDGNGNVKQAPSKEAEENVAENGKPTTADKGDQGKLVSAEESKKGSVGTATYWAYIKACGVLGVAIFLFLSVLSQIAVVGSNLWLAQWAAENERDQSSFKSSVEYNLLVYASLGLVQTFLVAMNQVVSKVWCAIRASKTLHSQMLATVVRAPQWWFDITPLGRILNRFTSDVNMVDQRLIRVLTGWVSDFLIVLSVIIVDSAATPVLLLFIIPLGTIYYYVGAYYVSSSRELQRLQSITRSPVFQQFSETLNGISTIRAFAQSRNFITESRQKLDDNLRARFARFSSNRWLAVRLEGIGSLILFGTALLSVLAIVRNPGTIPSSIVGLIISYALSLGDSLSWLVRESCDVENSVVAVERIEEYCKLPQEAPLLVDTNRPPETWPPTGAIAWQDYSTRYRPHLPLVLKDINLTVNGGEKIGLCGRTGSGKSSLALSLFRIVEPTSGRIVVDGVDVTDNFGLADLRANITVIPQDSLLFVGTVRSNLDPFDQYSDEEVWRVLEMSHLKEVVSAMQGGLDGAVAENGGNFSSGQQQLLALARALLRRTKILILDEASANLDLTSDALVQATIREAFADATVITIAHRLATILDHDRIVVLSDGRVLEVGAPGKLLADRSSQFYGLAKEAGIVKPSAAGGRETPSSAGRSTPRLEGK